MLEGQLKENKVYGENDASDDPLSSSTNERLSSDTYFVTGNGQPNGLFFSVEKDVPHYSGGSNPDFHHKYSPYEIRTNKYRPSSVTTNTEGITTTQDYVYGSSFEHAMRPTEVSTKNSDGDVYKTVTTFISQPGDRYTPTLVEKYVNDTRVDAIANIYRFFKEDGTDPSRSSSGRERVRRLFQVRRCEVTWTENGSIDNSDCGPPGFEFTNWPLQTTIPRYTSKGLVAEKETPGWPKEVYTYDNKRLATVTTQADGITMAKEYQYNNSHSKSPRRVIATDGTSITYRYDKLGRLESTTDDCTNIVTSNKYRFRYHNTNVNLVETTTDYTGATKSSSMDFATRRQFTDGLGRGTVQIAKHLGPNSDENVVTGQDYDQFGRVAKVYRPYTNKHPYASYEEIDDSRDHTVYTYRDDPTGRKQEVLPPNWHPTNYQYGANTTEDRVLKQDGTSSSYSAGTLTKRTVVDANGNKLIVFSDKIGRKLLSRRTDNADNSSRRHDTYYIYDQKGRSTAVLPPDTDKGDLTTYTYVYDGADNLISKTIPDRGTTNYFYNDRDELGAYQDENLAAAGEWYAYNYDGFGRGKVEGIRTTAPTNSFTNLTINTPLIRTLYGTAADEVDKVKEVRTRVLGTSDWLRTTNYYGSCGRLNFQIGNNHLNLDLSAQGRERTDYSYDGAGNLLRSTYQHRMPSGAKTNIVAEYNYDHAGRNNRNFFKVGGGVRQKISRIYYNADGSMDTKFQGATNHSSPRNYLQKIDYDYLDNGMLEGINMNGLTGGTGVGIPGQGQTGTVPAPAPPGSSYTSQTDLFSLQLYRDDVPSVNTNPAPGRYNGDITYVASQVRGRKQQVWGVEYDHLDRMTEARFYERDDANDRATLLSNYSEEVSYDRRGNIQNLTRYGSYKNSQNNYNHGKIDELDYKYADYTSGNEVNPGRSNRLKDVIDGSSGSQGYKDKNSSADYEYDDNGNVTYDPSRRVTISYNHLDLPVSIVPDNSGHTRLVMQYDASGTLLRRTQITFSGISLHTNFVGGIEYYHNSYTSPTLRAVNHSEGRIFYENGVERFDYALTDHLGNTRLLYTDVDGDGIAHVPEDIVQEEHYYPFGIKMGGPWMGATESGTSDPGYNGIDHVDDFGLDVNMAMYRTLDPSIGRWWQVDPKAEMYQSWSPYVSMGNSPMVQIDPRGDFLPLLPVVGALVGGTLNLASQALQGNVTSFGEGLSYFGVGAAAGVLATTGNLGAARAVTVGGNKVVQIATGKWSPKELTSGKGIAMTALSVAGDYGLPTLTNALAVPIAAGLAPLSQSASIFSTSVAGGGEVIKQVGVQAVDDIAFSVSLSDDIVVSASKLPNLGQKLKYIFGQATGRLHNIQRSQEMLRNLNRVGIFDNPAGRAAVRGHLSQAYNTAPGVLQESGRILRESLLMGPRGGVKVTSIWDADRLITVILKGGG